MSLTFAPDLFTAVVATGTENDPLLLEGNVCRVADGSLFLCWTGGGDFEPDERNISFFSRSTDNGRTWEAPTVFFSHAQKGMMTAEIFTYGDTLFALPASYYNSTGFVQDCNCYLSRSTDSGHTFTPPAPLGRALNGFLAKTALVLEDRILVSGTWYEGSREYWAPRQGAKKSMVAGREIPAPPVPVSFRESGRLSHHKYSGVLISQDGGASWRLSGRTGTDKDILMEPALNVLSDGTLVFLIRRDGDHHVWKSVSTDRGETWSPAEPTDIPTAITKVALIRDKAGTLYLLNNPNPDSTDRTPLSLWISHDDMKTWDTKVDLVASSDGSPCCYPDGFIDEERGMLCFSWDDRRHIYYSEYPIR